MSKPVYPPETEKLRKVLEVRQSTVCEQVQVSKSI